MNWFNKMAQVEDFTERNVLNHRIDDLKEIAVNLMKLSKLVYQSGQLVKNDLDPIRQDKRLSSFPQIEELLKQADKACLDSPHRTADLLHKAADEVAKRVTTLERERADFVRRQGTKGKKDGD